MLAYGDLVKEKREPFETNGIDSDSCMEALLFSEEALTSLLKFAQEKNANKSDSILTMILGQAFKEDYQSRYITTWVQDTVKSILEIEEPTAK